ncbi:transposase, partial [Proteus mirabilis]|uniref:transposase n=1 Tax=Proteus mirabilis TaxID=584 RepID=UPI00385D61B8
HFNPFNIKISTNTGKVASQFFNCILLKYFSPVFSHIANIRKDYLHKVTSEISKNHAMIVIEDLKVSNMSKSAKGT